MYNEDWLCIGIGMVLGAVCVGAIVLLHLLATGIVLSLVIGLAGGWVVKKHKGANNEVLTGLLRSFGPDMLHEKEWQGNAYIITENGLVLK